MVKYSEDKLKTGLLVELTLYMQKMFSKYVCECDVPQPLPLEKDKSGKKKTGEDYDFLRVFEG